jgi:hypothetical protein
MTLGNMRANDVRMERRRALIRARLSARPKSGVRGATMFQFLRGIALFAAIVFCCEAAVAAADIDSANYHMAGCRSLAAQSLTPGTDFERGLCVGIIDALMGVGPRLGICVPSEATKGQGVLVVVRYIDGRPARMHENFGKLALEALRAAWPCKK